MPREVGSYMHQKRQKIALIFNANKAYDRGADIALTILLASSGFFSGYGYFILLQYLIWK